MAHRLLHAMLEQIPRLAYCDFIAHALVAATPADLVEHLAGQERVPRERLHPAGHTTPRRWHAPVNFDEVT